MSIILHELNQLEQGGVERIVLTIAKHDKENQHGVIAYKEGPMREEFEAAGIPVHHVKPGDSIDLEANLIHIHTGGGASTLAAQMGKSFPIIETIHSPVKSAVRRELVKRKIGVSNVVARMNPGAMTIHNGVDLDRLREPKSKEQIRQELGIPQDALVIGRIGRIAPDKYVEEFLLAMREFQKERDCYVVIAGQESTKPGYLGTVKLTAECLGIKNAIFPGFSNPRDIVPAFDAFLYPSKDEGFGLVFMEVMWLGVPIITYKTDLTQELLGGFAVLTGPSIKNLSDGVRAALNPMVSNYFVEKGPELVEGDFSGERMAEEYAQVYREVIEECPLLQTSSEIA